jgi:DNA repair exonuclease SbcCD nuclease subunit
MITIYHAADLHLGLKFSKKSDAVRRQLIQDRFDALKNIIDAANIDRAQFLVIAGDLFDSVQVGVQETINPTANLLGTFQGEAVLVLPGNHDFYEANQGNEAALTLWTRFNRAASSHPKIHVFTEPSVLSYEIGDEKLNFFPGLCTSKHSPQHAIGWISEVVKDNTALNIGVAHGNVDGYGLDSEGRYFNMTEADLTATGLDFTLLGHIHVPYPTQTTVISKPLFFMPGTTAQSAMGRKGKGTYWKIQCDGKSFHRAELKVSSEVEHIDWSNKVVNSTADVNQLLSDIAGLDQNKSLLRLRISGRLISDELVEFRNDILALRDHFIELDFTDSIILNIDEAFINANYRHNSLGFKLLDKLNQEDPDGLALQLAYDLLRQI